MSSIATRHATLTKFLEDLDGHVADFESRPIKDPVTAGAAVQELIARLIPTLRDVQSALKVIADDMERRKGD